MLMVGSAYAITDDFESYNVGDIATGWIYAADANPLTTGTVSDAQSVSGDQSLYFNCAGDGEAAYAYLLTGQGVAKGSIALSFYFSTVEPSQWFFLRQEAIDENDIKYVIAEWRVKRTAGIQEYCAYTEFMGGAISSNAWHTLQIDFDHAAEKYDLSLDGNLIGDDLSYVRGNATCETINISLGDFKTLAYYNLDGYFDDVSVESEFSGGEGNDIVDIAVTDNGVELAFELIDVPAYIEWADDVSGPWNTAMGIYGSGTFPFTVENHGSRMYSAFSCSDGKVYGSTYQYPQFYEFDLSTRENTVHGIPFNYGGQVYTMVEYSPTKVYFASYTYSDVIVLDPTQPWSTVNGKAQPSGTNPISLGKLGDEQNRPIDGVLGPDGYIYIANFPDYGVQGGALTKLDPTTDTWVNYRSILDIQSLCTVSIIEGDNRYIAGGTIGEAQGFTPWGDAKLFIWDTTLNTVAYSVEPPVGENVREVSQLESTEDGILIGLCSDGVNSLYSFAFDPVSRTFLNIQNITGLAGTYYIIGNLTEPYQGYMYFTAHSGRVLRVNTSTYAVDIAATHSEAFKGGSLATDPLNENKTCYLVMTKTELMAMTLDAPMYQFTNFGRMVDQPYQGDVIYGYGADGVLDTIYMVFNNFYQNWILIALDTITGQYTQYVAPDAEQARYGQAIGSDGKVYVITPQGGKVFAFDPKNSAAGIVDLGVASSGETYLFDLDPGTDGNLYFGSYPNGKLLSYNIASGTFIDYGEVSGDEMYVRYVAPYDENYAYARVGPVDRRLFRVNLLTHAKEQVPLPAEFDNFYLYQGTDGLVYCTQGGTYLRIDGLSTTVVGSKPKRYGVTSILDITFGFDWANLSVSYERTGSASVYWVDNGDTASGRTGPQNESKRFYRIKY
jgi:hypothetical protein